MKKIAIVGFGMIGRAWSIVFARAGHPVAAFDPVTGAADRSLKLLETGLHDLEEAGLLDDAAVAGRRIAVAGSLAEALDGAEHVQENGPEDVEAKRCIFAELDRLAPPGAVLASSTSAIMASSFTEDLAGRARCLVAHPVNPPHLVPLVELCGAPWTSADTIQRTRQIMESAGQVPVLVKREVEGFILNRLQGALLNEAFRLIDEGYVGAADLDKTVRDGLGLRWSFMGPMETIDLNAPEGVADYLRRYGPMYRRMAEEVKAQPIWNERVGRTIEAQRRQELPADRLLERQGWRDRRLMALLRHKAVEKKRLG